MRRSRPVRLIQLCRCISTTPDSGAYWRLGFSHPGHRRPARSGSGITAPTLGDHRRGQGRPAEHAGPVSTATWSPVLRNSRLRLPATTGPRVIVGVARRRSTRACHSPRPPPCRACPYPARGFGCKGPPPSTADTDRLLLPEIRSTGADSPESVARRIGSRWPAAQPAASSGRGRAAVIEDGRRGTPAPPGRWTWYVRTATGSGTGRAGSARLPRRGRRTIPGRLGRAV